MDGWDGMNGWDSGGMDGWTGGWMGLDIMGLNHIGLDCRDGRTDCNKLQKQWIQSCLNTLALKKGNGKRKD